MKKTLLRSFRSRILAVVAMLPTLGILGYLVYREREILWAYEWRINWLSLALAFVAMLGTMMIVALTWILEIRSVGSRLPISIHLNHYVASHLMRRLPGTVWYIVGRGYLYQRQGESAKLVAVVSSLEFVLLTLGGALVALMLWGIGFHNASGGYLWALIAAIVLGALIVQPTSTNWILQRVGNIATPQLRYRQLFTWLMLYILAWFGSGLVFYLLSHAFFSLGPEHMLYAIGIWALIGALSSLVFFLPSNFGFTEIGIALLMSAVMPTSVAAMLALVTRITLTIFDLLTAGLWFGSEAIWQKVGTKSKHKMPPITEEK